MRKAFNFYRSYYDVAKQLHEEERYKFLWALLEKQFDGKEPELDGISNFAYISQKHSIDAQVTGYETKTGTTVGGAQGGIEGASVQEKEKGKEEVQEKEKGKEIPIDWRNANLGADGHQIKKHEN